MQTSTLLDPSYQPVQRACRSPTRKSGHQQLRIVLVVHHAGLDGCSRATPAHVKHAGCAEPRSRPAARSHPRSFRRISLEMDCNANEIVPADSRGGCRRVVSFHTPHPHFSSLRCRTFVSLISTVKSSSPICRNRSICGYTITYHTAFIFPFSCAVAYQDNSSPTIN